MKRKQKSPRRIRPVWKTPDGSEKDQSPISDSVYHDAEAKRLRVEKDFAIDNAGDGQDVSEWKWSISDFRKEHLGNSKEQLDDSREQLKDSTEHSSHANELSNESNDASSSLKEISNSLDTSKECSKSSKHSSEIIFKEAGKTSEENEESCKEYWESLKPNLRNPPEVLLDQNQLFQYELNSNTAEKNKEVEKEAINMPVILNVFSLSKARQSNTKKENSVLFTPSCSPPFVQLGPFCATPVSFQNPRTCDGFISQVASHQGQENIYKSVQQVHQNYPEYLSIPPHQVSSQNQREKQVNNFREYLSYPVEQVSSAKHLKYKVYSNQPVQQVHSNFQEMQPKPVQRVDSQQYLNRPNQVYYTDYQENWAYPVQHVNSHEYISKPVQQVYYNPPPGYLSRPVQPVNLQEYQPTTSPEYLPNPTQKVNPVNPQDPLYNPLAHNLQQIANGVLPLGKQIANQSTRERHVQPNTVPLFNQGYNHTDGNEQQPVAQLQSLLTDSYLVENGNSVAKGNGMYSRFKLKQPLAESYKVAHQPNEILPQFFQIPPVNDGANVGTANSGNSHPKALNVLSNTPSSARSHNEVNTTPNYSNGVYTDKYRTDYGCSAILDGYGRNRVLSTTSNSPTNNNNVFNMYSIKQSEDPFPTSTMIPGKKSSYSEKPFCTSTIYIPSSGGESGEPGTKNPLELLSIRDAKVNELKRRLEEQEATLKKLRANIAC